MMKHNFHIQRNIPVCFRGLQYKQILFRPYLLLILLLALAVNVHAQANQQEFAWVKNINNMGGKNYNNIRVSSSTDKNGYVYVTGVMYGDLSYGITNQLLTLQGWQDAFIMKIAGDGQVVWSKQFAYKSNNAQTRGMSVSIDDIGNVYVAGRFSKTIDFNPSASGTQTVTSSGIWDAFVCKLDVNGDFEWVRTWGRSGGRTFADYVAVGPSGSIYITGTFGDSLNLNPGAGKEMAYASGAPSPTHPTNPIVERFICKLDASGNYTWGNHFEEGLILNGDEINSLGLAVDTSGNAYIAGTYRSIAFPAGSGMSLPIIGEMDMYILKVNNSGNFVWAKGFGGSGTDMISDITSDNGNHLYISGSFGRTSDLDPNRGGKYFSSTGGSVYYDAFVLKINTNGEYVWANTFGSEKHDNAHGVAVDRLGNVYVTGGFRDSVKFVPGSTNAKDNIVSNGGYDIFVVKYDSTGKYNWSKSMGSANAGPAGGTGPDCGDVINVDPFGNIYVTGYFNGNADFNQGGTPKAELDAKEGNMFLLKYGSICDTTSSTLETNSCGSFAYNGKTFDKSGVYKEVLMNAAGCDSMVYLYLTINPLPVPIINVAGFTLGTAKTYSTYQWLLNGNAISGSGATNGTYTVQTNGNYQVVVTDAAGCSDTSAVYTVTNHTSIGDVSSFAHQITIYPNPTTDRIYINSPTTIHIALVSIEGRVLVKAQSPDYIELGRMAAGVYFLRITDKDGRLVKVEKIVKK